MRKLFPSPHASSTSNRRRIVVQLVQSDKMLYFQLKNEAYTIPASHFVILQLFVRRSKHFIDEEKCQPLQQNEMLSFSNHFFCFCFLSNWKKLFCEMNGTTK